MDVTLIVLITLVLHQHWWVYDDDSVHEDAQQNNTDTEYHDQMIMNAKLVQNYK